ncbi:DUF1622 domain-containing protein [uncultured Tenacibaculum sp.]|uniref:DUF1622 domain-containing protein n=1 Tax=uncultured Tenacibaculum sp. TaxID=174713 RepID=UPI00261014C4|nr:DUF1622 domain-containing protein [uncultured Tenacibaculum sp.]
MEGLNMYINCITKTIEFIGVLVIFFGTVYSIARFLISLKRNNKTAYTSLRQSLGKSILLGLEILIAADIMETVTTAPTLKSAAVLGLIVFIRTFMSMSLEVELEGRFPWQKTNNNK